MLYSGSIYIVLFFIYGISFFTMGVIALQQNIQKETNFPLLKAIRNLGLFGILHAFVEWLIMFVIADIFPDEKLVFLMIAVFMNALSFTILLYFGIKVIDYKGKGISVLKWLPWMIFVIWVFFYESNIISNGEISFRINLDFDTLCRYFIGFPAAILTATALFYNANALEIMKLKKTALKFRLLAASFISYGIFAGLLVNQRDFFPANVINKQAFLELFGFPVELGRMLSAICITILFIVIIDIFRLENNIIMQNLMQERVASQERRRLGRDLHDGIIQDLFASGLQLESLLEENDVNLLHSELKHIKVSLNDGIQKIREFIEKVSTKKMDLDQFRLQLEETIINFKKISKANIYLDYGIPDITLHYVSSDKLTQIYYIIQEAVSNSVKHSNATEIKVKIGFDLRSIIVEINDNGKGFNKSSARGNRKYGLSSMQERAASTDGILNINSDSKGTKIILIVPWEDGLNE
jgi:signal transduction histidine kinase